MSVTAKLQTALARDLRAGDNASKFKLAAQWVGGKDGSFHQEAMDVILGELRTMLKGSAASELAEWTRSLPDNSNAAYLKAKITAQTGNATGACEHWANFFALHDRTDAANLAAYARVLADSQRFDEAALQLRRALDQRPSYGFYPRIEKLVDSIAGSVDSHLRECRVAVLGNSTTGLLIPVLQACLLRDRIKGEIYQGLYGNTEQEIRDPASGLAHFQPTVVFLLSSWRDLHLPGVVEEEAGLIANEVERARQRWRLLGEKYGCHVVQFAWDYPGQEAYTYLSGSLTGGRTRLIGRLNSHLLEEAPSNVSILDTPAVQRAVGSGWEDAMLWHSFQQHPASEALPALADAMAAHVRAVLGLTRKVVIADLDNTLWHGVIGEDGLSGIKIGPGSPKGEAHRHLQAYLLDLKARGILLAVASKNNHEDATLPFLKHEHMLLRMEDFAAFEANWNDKATSIREIARKLSLGLDSFVFLDDNPLERAWVRSQLPDVAVVDLGPSVFHYVQDLDRAGHFFATALSSEDQSRTVQYRSEAARKHLQASADSLDDFLKQLQLRASVARVEKTNLARVTQLTNKTNQFNLTTRRYTEAQVTLLAADPSAWLAAFHLADRMGDYGLIGVLFCKVVGASTWEIDLWLMSCRVLGRQVEKFMFDHLVKEAQARGIREIVGVYRPTAKNGLVRDLFPQLGFTVTSEDAEEVRYVLVVKPGEVRTATHVRDVSQTVAAPAEVG